MLRWLLPRDDRFFQLAEESARNALDGAHALRELLANYTDVENKVRRLHDLEHRGDNITHSIMNDLDATFVTPIDREDIHELATALDNVIDFIDAGGKRLFLLGIRTPTPEMGQLADVIIRAVEEIVKLCPKLAHARLYEEVRIHLEEINRLENEGDRIHHAALRQLFEKEADAKELIRIKEVLEFLEGSIDMCERVADVVQSIVVKNA